MNFITIRKKLPENQVHFKMKFVRSNISQSSTNSKLLLFDLIVGGHHGSYIQHLIESWCEEELSGILNIVVSPNFLQVHSDVVDIALKHKRVSINFIPITSEEEASLHSNKSSIRRAFRAFGEWELLCKYAEKLGATHCLIMYFDTCELPLTAGMKSPCPFSGIYFRPTFHYGDFADYAPSWKDKVQQWREKFTLGRILRHPQLQTLFCLDPFAVKHIGAKFSTQAEVVHLPDPVQIHQNYKFQQNKLPESIGIDPDRRVFLLFGALTGRKGIFQLLEAILLLPSELCRKLCILLVGSVDHAGQANIKSKVATICQDQPVKIIEHYEFVPERDVPAYFQLADVVLATYQRHVGMSGILLLAAAARKPLLSSNYGLMGEIVRRYSLGIAVDSTVPSEIAKGLTRFLLESPQEFCDQGQMEIFAKQNDSRTFASKIFQKL